MSLSSSSSRDIQLKSDAHLKLNFTESLIEVLHVICSSYDALSGNKSIHPPHLKDKGKHEKKHDKFIGFMERISISVSVSLEQIGFSLINSLPEELLFICAKNIMVDLVQSLDQQKLSFQIASLQIDNQPRSSPYPVMLSFEREYKNDPAGHVIQEDDMKSSERIFQRTSHNFEPVFCLAVFRRKKDASLFSFECSVADVCLELQQDLILSLSGFNGSGSLDAYATDNRQQIYLLSCLVEGAQIHLQQLTIADQIASLKSLPEILTRQYTPQLRHEMYKMLPSKVFTLIARIVYAISDAATQFSKAAQKGIVEFTFDDEAV